MCPNPRNYITHNHRQWRAAQLNLSQKIQELCTTYTGKFIQKNEYNYHRRSGQAVRVKFYLPVFRYLYLYFAISTCILLLLTVFCYLYLYFAASIFILLLLPYFAAYVATSNCILLPLPVFCYFYLYFSTSTCILLLLPVFSCPAAV